MEFKPPPLPEALLWRNNYEEIVKRAGVVELYFAVLRLVLLHLLHLLHQQLVPDAHPAHLLLLHLPPCFSLLFESLGQRDHVCKWGLSMVFNWTLNRLTIHLRSTRWHWQHVWSISYQLLHYLRFLLFSCKLSRYIIHQTRSLLLSSIISSFSSSVQSSSCRSEPWAQGLASAYLPSEVACNY